MTKVFKTTSWKKLVIEYQWWIEKFNFYFDDVKLYYNTRDYCDFWDFTQYEVEYLQWKYDDDIKNWDCEKNEKLEKLKLDNIIIWFNIVDYWSNGCKISKSYDIECDGFLIFKKDAKDEYINYVFDCLEKRWNWEIYCVWVYSPVYYKRMDKNLYWEYEYVKHYENIDYGDGFFDFEDAKNSYWEEIIKGSECDNFYEYELIDAKQYKLETQPSKE